MKAKFKNITICSKELYNQFSKFHNKTYKNNYKWRRIGITVLLLYFLLFYIYINNIIMIIIAVFTITGYFKFRGSFENGIKQKELNSEKIVKTQNLTYNFYEKYFTVENDIYIEKIKYIKLHRIYQDNYNYYFYRNIRHAFIVSRKGFIEGTDEEFEKFISQKYKFK